MKRILLSGATLVAVLAVVTGGTIAFFSDTETSTGNILTAGTLDLKVDSFGSTYSGGDVLEPSWAATDLTDEKFFNFAAVTPGDYGWRSISLHAEEAAAYACLVFDNKVDNENTRLTQETNAGDTSDDVGELSQYLNVFVWEDDDANGLYDPSDETELTSTPDSFFDIDYITYSDSGNSVSPIGTNSGSDIRNLGVFWCAGTLTVDTGGDETLDPGETGSTLTCDGSGMTDVTQTDSFVADLVLYAEQSQNNNSFMCSSLGPAAGANLAAYSAPATCDITVDDDGSTGYTDIQSAINAASSGQTICVEDGTYASAEIDKPLTLASLTGPTNTATIAGVRIRSNDVTVTGFKITPAFFPNTHAAVYMDLSSDNVEVSYNDIDENGYGGTTRGIETLYNGTYNNVSFVNNYIHGFSTGIYTNPNLGGKFTIDHNSIHDNGAGLAGFNNSVVTYNDFEGNSGAIGADQFTLDDGSYVSYNNFHEDQDFVVYNPWPTEQPLSFVISAPNNWWYDGGVNQTTPGAVDFAPERGNAFPTN